MFPENEHKQVINGKIYSTEKADMVAHNSFWDGRNFERNGRNQFLYKTEKGNFFLFTMTMWQGELDRIVPLTKDEAKETWEELPEQEMEYFAAFGEKPEEA